MDPIAVMIGMIPFAMMVSSAIALVLILKNDDGKNKGD